MIHDLEQDVVDVTMRFLDLIEDHDTVGVLCTASVNWPPCSKPIIGEVLRSVDWRCFSMYSDMSNR